MAMPFCHRFSERRIVLKNRRRWRDTPNTEERMEYALFEWHLGAQSLAKLEQSEKADLAAGDCRQPSFNRLNACASLLGKELPSLCDALCFFPETPRWNLSPAPTKIKGCFKKNTPLLLKKRAPVRKDQTSFVELKGKERGEKVYSGPGTRVPRRAFGQVGLCKERIHTI